MKKPFEDRMTEKIKEVMEQYEPPYSPQAWEKLRDQMPVPVFWLKRLLLKYKFLVSDIAIIGVLVMVYNFSSVRPADNNSAIVPIFSETANYLVSEKPLEINYPEKRAASRQSISDIDINQDEKTSPSKFMPDHVPGSLPAAYQDYTQTGTAIEKIPESIENKPVPVILFEGKDFDYQYNIPQLIPLKSQSEEIPVLKSHSSVKTGKSKFQWPEFNSLITKEEGYDKFVGPSKLALFYSPEMLQSNSLGNLGVSQGVGFSLEGSLGSSVSMSAGLSYQAINFHNTISSGNVPESPDDTIYIESGNYKYLEVPISLNFKFFESNRSQLWFGTGISTIVFLKQDYSSEIIIGGISDQVSYSSAKAWENFLPVASLNLSLLYRYQFTDRFFLHSSLQYKLPLVPLGYNSMKLNRLNFQVGIIYRFRREE